VIELVALDIAGTTIDDAGAVYDALLQAALGTGAACSESDVEQWMGADKRAALAALAALGGVSLDSDGVELAYSAFSRLLAERYRDHPPSPISGVPAAMSELQAKGVRVALTTGFAGDVAHRLLESVGWRVGDGLIDAVVCVDEVPAGRPAPDLIREAMRRTGVIHANHVLAAGDTVVDLRAARNAGVVAVGVGTGKLGLDGLRAEDHDYLLDSAAELPALVAALARP
jgi:phosphonatase-like hydrolase